MELPDRFIHQTTRYILGRATYAVSDHCDWLIANWDTIPENERKLIQKDVEEAFAFEERIKHTPEAVTQRLGALGMDMDKQYWERVRTLWKD